MSYVQPSGRIELFRGIKLDNRYMHTLYFANTSEQTNFFDGLTNKVAFTAQSYSRPNRNTVRVAVNAEDVQTVSYMRFNNRNNKWYYAFVLAINYVNENVTDIVYEIDVMQTWFIQAGTLQPCYIERQHVTDDTFGLNLEAEPVGSETYDFTEITVQGMATDFSDYQVVWNTTDEPDSGNMIRDGIVNGTNFDYIGATDSGMVTLKNELGRALGSWDKNEQKADIVDLYMFPTEFTFEGHNAKTYHAKHDGKFDNYTPKNNKLFMYPYSCLFVTTNDGDTAMYKWEYFEGDIIHDQTGAQFNLNATLTGGGMIEIHPASYNGISENYDSKLVMNNFPKCAMGYDAYQAWIASGGQYKAEYERGMIQKKGALAIAQAGLNAVTSIAGIDYSAQANSDRKNPAPNSKYGVGAVSSAVSGMLNIEQTSLNYEEARTKVNFEFKDARYEPNILVGQQVPNISVGKKFLCFKFYKLHVRDDEAKRIDDFFSVYGYSINKVETPNITGRKYWNFIKTRNAEVTGNMPSSSRAAIAKIFDGGIFFWKSHANLGNFAVSSSDGSINNPISNS